MLGLSLGQAMRLLVEPTPKAVKMRRMSQTRMKRINNFKFSTSWPRMHRAWHIQMMTTTGTLAWTLAKLRSGISSMISKSPLKLLSSPSLLQRQVMRMAF